MAALELILAAFGVLFVLLMVVAFLGERRPKMPTPPEEDRAAPYREGLHAAVRLQRSAQDLEQQIWAEAARHQNASPTVGGSRDEQS
jgi:hypothetical protein